MKRIIIDVFGIVQGVFFRHNTQKIARKLNLTGYVRNMSNGSVHIEAEGPQEKLEELLKFAKIGPIYARVDKINYRYIEPTNEFSHFSYSF
ncbi:MAG: acylphosphatase [Candidatus Lokiarchaeota archaeon]|nr:acylphosphatase [Candidatus Lokiarchaeota archaeon]